MTKWELARYLIDAKKAVDTILFLSKSGEKVSMIDIRNVVKETKQKFYVNACIVLDKSFPNKKKEICKNEIINSIYYERDKNYAHKDENYVQKHYDSMDSIANEMKKQLDAVFTLCRDFLPESLTLDYLPFDSTLFRLANGITKEMEEAAFETKHPNTGIATASGNTKVFNVFADTEDIRTISPDMKKEYATIFCAGINMEETLQNLQDGCIKTNVLHGLNMWVSINYDLLAQIVRMRELGLLDIMDVPYTPKNRRDEKRIIALLKKEGLLNEQT